MLTVGPRSYEDHSTYRASGVKYIIADDTNKQDPAFHICEKYYMDDSMPIATFVEAIVQQLYQVGLVGVKLDSHAARAWSFQDDPMLLDGQIGPSSSIEIHKTFWAALGVTRDG